MASAEVTRVIYLAFLAPDIVERIVRGGQPIDLNSKRLLAMAPLPMAWAEQRRVLGFDHRPGSKRPFQGALRHSCS